MLEILINIVLRKGKSGFCQLPGYIFQCKENFMYRDNKLEMSNFPIVNFFKLSWAQSRLRRCKTV